MRSKASFRSHPIHPALIPFPFAFLSGALLFDIAGHVMQRPGWWVTGSHLAIAGVATALVAAVPGLIDYIHTVPPKSSGKRRATRHMIVNLSAVALMAAAWLLRDDGPNSMALGIIALETVAIALLVAGGWMGGVLVNRNQIGVDHRYAGAGKWNEQSFDSRSPAPLVVAMAGELEVDQMKLLRIDGRRIVLARSEKGYVAFDDRCTHRGASLADGVMICGTVQCPWHGSQFDVATGKVDAGPAEEAIGTYRIEETDADVRLFL